MRKKLFTLAAFATMTASLLLATSSSAGIQGGSTLLTTPLTGQEEIDPQTMTPGAGDLDAFGFAVVRINTDTDRICWTLLASGIQQPATAAHIHEAPAGANGPVLVPLTAPTVGTGFLGDLGIAFSRGCTTSTDADRIAANPSGFYVNVHNEPFPAGAIRGQL